MSALRPLWSLRWNASPRGMALARESGHILVWDDHNWLTLLNHKGERQAQHHRTARILSAAIAEDGSATIVIDAEHHLAMLGPDLNPLWDRTLSQKLNAIAIDTFGEHLALAEASGRVRLIDRMGQLVRDFPCPRPAQHLVFVPTGTRLYIAADFGLVSCLDLLTSEWLWRDTPVVHHGSLAVTGTGDLVLLACFTDGLRVYDGDGKTIPLEAKFPCRAAVTAFDARLIVGIGLQQSLFGISPTGKQRFEQKGEHSWLAVAVAGLGDKVFAASAEPRLFAWSVPQ